MKTTYLTVLVAATVAFAIPRPSPAEPIVNFTIFDNQFGGTWATSDGDPIVNYTPNNVGDTFSNNSDSNGATWTVTQLTPQPWSNGTVVFAGGGNTSGTITTEFNTLNMAEYTVDWASILVGTANHQLSASVYDGSGTGGSILDTETLLGSATGQLMFTGDGGPVTLEIDLILGAPNASSDIFLDFVTVTGSATVPEPKTVLLALLGVLPLAFPALRKRQRP